MEVRHNSRYDHETAANEMKLSLNLSLGYRILHASERPPQETSGFIGEHSIRPVYCSHSTTHLFRLKDIPNQSVYLNSIVVTLILIIL